MRRVHVQHLTAGALVIPPAEAHHLRDVLRVREGDAVELFDDAGRSATGEIGSIAPHEMIVHVGPIRPPAARRLEWTVAAAVPKGNRADWMIEKLSELGTTAFVPLRTARSVVLPEGAGKLQRWQRLAAESAKQSRRAGVMRIAPLTDVRELVRTIAGGWYFSTGSAVPVALAVERLAQGETGEPRSLAMLIGPEGGWTEDELEFFKNAGLTAVSLGATILRIETAAVAAAVVVAALLPDPRIEP